MENTKDINKEKENETNQTNSQIKTIKVSYLWKKGNNFVSRCGESINLNLEFKEFIANDDNDYVKIAKELNENREKISFIRKSLREKTGVCRSEFRVAKRFSKVYLECLLLELIELDSPIEDVVLGLENQHKIKSTGNAKRHTV